MLGWLCTFSNIGTIIWLPRAGQSVYIEAQSHGQNLNTPKQLVIWRAISSEYSGK